jgi:hypothetical protein
MILRITKINNNLQNITNFCKYKHFTQLFKTLEHSTNFQQDSIQFYRDNTRVNKTKLYKIFTTLYTTLPNSTQPFQVFTKHHSTLQSSFCVSKTCLLRKATASFWRCFSPSISSRGSLR